MNPMTNQATRTGQILSPEHTYEQFRTSREEKLQQIKEDSLAIKERELDELNKTLDVLILKINSAKSDLAEEERNFCSEKESLLTIMNKIRVGADAKSSESRVQFLQTMEQMQRKHEIALQEYAQGMQQLQIPNENIKNQDNIDRRGLTIGSAKLKHDGDGNKYSEIGSENQYDYIYSSRVIEIEAKKREILLELKEKEQMNKVCVTELTRLLDNEDEKFHKDLKVLEKEMHKSEEQYEKELEKLNNELEKEKNKRKDAIERKNEKVIKLQNHIDDVEHQFKEKLQHANNMAEKLKAALVNVNLRKSQLLEMEKQRSFDHQNLIKESYTLQKSINKISKELELTKKDSSYLRCELSSKIGPRRSASLLD